MNSEVLTLLTAAKWQQLPVVKPFLLGQKVAYRLGTGLLFSPSVCPVLMLDPGVDLPAGHSLKVAREKDVICWEELGCTGRLDLEKEQMVIHLMLPINQFFFFFFLKETQAIFRI